MSRDLLTVIAERRAADIERLRRVAASGRSGAVAAREAMQRLRTEELREAVAR